MAGREFWSGKMKDGVKAGADFSKLLSGSLGRLFISLAYFVSVANSLSVAEFGLFATASAVGIVLSRIAGLGFVSPLYRVATRKSHLVGIYSLGLLIALAISLPLVGLAGAFFYALVFAGEMALLPFVLIVAAEVLFWRPLEIVCIVNNGMGRFGRAALVVIMGSALRALTALGFAAFGDGTLGTWAALYALANAVAMLVAFVGFYPRRRLRYAPRLYLARWRDSLMVAGAEIAFYLQSELDKLLVLGLAGPYTAGIYAILSRLIDLTALPIRSFNTLIVQKIMRTPGWIASWSRRWSIEAGVAAVSVAGITVLGTALWFAPRLLGDNVADAAPLLLLALTVPAFRNLIEYESELLYARGLTGVRLVILALLALSKAGLLSAVLVSAPDERSWILGLNGVFATLWLISVTTTYTALDWRWGRGTDAGFSAGRRQNG